MITMADATEFSPMGALDIAGLRDGFRGELLRPQDSGYEDARKVWNGSITRFPALIARCAGVADVIAAVKFAKDNGLLVAVRGGGHSFPGLSVCDGGLVIDLSLMKGIRVDPEARTVRAQAGVLLGELDRDTQAFGLAVPSGIVTHTGVSGLTLGGGINWLQRKYGLAIDQLLSVDLITAEGGFVKASASENSDLFWGVRGGGGESREAAQGVRISGTRSVRAQTLPRPPGDVRSFVPARAVVLHSVLRRCAAHR